MSISERDRAEFVARVTTDVTHELRNVLAIVKETAGLIQDFMTCDQPDSIDHDKVKSLVGRIEPHAERGAELTSVLQHVAQSCEEPGLSTNLSQAATQVVVMCHRCARKKRQSVRVGPHDHKVHVVGNRLGVYMAIHAAIECSLELLPESAVLDINFGAPVDLAPVEFVGSLEESAVGIDPTQALAWNTLNKAVADIGASLTVGETECSLQIGFPVTSVG